MITRANPTLHSPLVSKNLFFAAKRARNDESHRDQQCKKNVRMGAVKATVQDSYRDRLIINTEDLPSPKFLKMFN